MMDLNDMDPVLLVAALTQQIAEQEKRAAACSEDAENKAALSKNLLRRGSRKGYAEISATESREDRGAYWRV